MFDEKANNEMHVCLGPLFTIDEIVTIPSLSSIEQPYFSMQT
jgi:hypothetical protein